MSKYILWNPNSDKPPKKKFDSYTRAVDTAEWAARKNPSETFIVAELKEAVTFKDTGIVIEPVD